MGKFKKGDRVNFTIEVKGGIVTDVNPNGSLEIDPAGSVELYNDDDYLKIDSIDPAICTYAEPIAWPPQVGDVWNADGTDWFAMKQGGTELPLLVCVDSRKTNCAYDPSQIERADAYKALNPILHYRPAK